MLGRKISNILSGDKEFNDAESVDDYQSVI